MVAADTAQRKSPPRPIRATRRDRMRETIGARHRNDQPRLAALRGPVPQGGRLVTKRAKLLTFDWERDLLEGSDVPPNAVLVGLAMKHHADRDGTNIFPSIDRLVLLTRLSRSVVIRWRTTLEELGWITLVSQGGLRGDRRDANVYRLSTPENAATSWADASQELKDRALDKRHARRKNAATGAATIPVADGGDPLTCDSEAEADVGRTGAAAGPVDLPIGTVAEPGGGTGRADNGYGARASTGTEAGPYQEDLYQQDDQVRVASDVASDADPEPTEPGTSSAKAKEPSHPNYAASFDVVAEAFGYNPVGLPTAVRNAVNRACKGAFRAGLLDDLDRLRDVIWLYRGSRLNPDLGTFAVAAADTLSQHGRLLAHRAAAAPIATAAIAEVGAGPGGRAASVPAAEFVVASRLDAGDAEPEIAAALRQSRTWTVNALSVEIDRAAGSGRRLSAVPDPAPEDLDAQSAADLVALLRRGLPPFDVARVTAALQGKAEAATPPQRAWLRRELQTGAFPGENLVSAAVQALLESLRPQDPAREAAAAADRAVFAGQAALTVGEAS